MFRLKRMNFILLGVICLLSAFLITFYTSENIKKTNVTNMSNAYVANDYLFPTINKQNVFNTHDLTSWLKQREYISKKVKNLLGQVPYKTSQIRVTILSEHKKDGYYLKKIVYPVSSDEMVRAYILEPIGLVSKRPAILALHQTVESGKDQVVGISDTDKDMWYALELVKKGYIVMAPDAPFTGERISKNETAYDTAKFYEKYPNWSAVGKALFDNQIALTVLSQTDYVDKNKIGVIGHSQGGVDALFLGAMDERIKVIAISCGLGTLKGDPIPEKWARDSGWVGIPKLKKEIVSRNYTFDFYDLVALIAPKPFISFSATNDYVFPNYQGVHLIESYTSPIYKLYNKEKNVRIITFTGSHSFPIENRTVAYMWFEKFLGKYND